MLAVTVFPPDTRPAEATLLELELELVRDEVMTADEVVATDEEDELGRDELVATDEDVAVGWQAALVPQSHTMSSIAKSKVVCGN